MSATVPHPPIWRPVTLWLLNFLIAGVLGYLVMLQQTVNHPNVVASLHLLPPNSEGMSQELQEAVAEAAQDGQAPAVEAQPLVEIPSELKSRLVEIGEEPYWSVVASEDAEVTEGSWHTVLVQNRTKFDSTQWVEASRDWLLVEHDERLKVQFRSEVDAMRDILSRKNRGKYAVQMVSLPEREFAKAVELMRRLQREGHYAYLHRTENAYKGTHWFRVRVGFFKNPDEARTQGQEILEHFRAEKLFPESFWPVRPSSQELSKELLDLRKPLNKPWVLTLPLYADLAAALKDVAALAGKVDASYLSARMDSESGQPQYRLRIGFYEKEGEATAILRRLKKEKTPPFLSEASVARL
ncbi:MAG: SPOR domain-containing protein [SAR324 cluster bacterium]|nr:SPOR domain-containing protein [SAR324 cluster bacterium]